jgi:hypothetical protein
LILKLVIWNIILDTGINNKLEVPFHLRWYIPNPSWHTTLSDQG